jgi:hypothetical protein
LRLHIESVKLSFGVERLVELELEEVVEAKLLVWRTRAEGVSHLSGNRLSTRACMAMVPLGSAPTGLHPYTSPARLTGTAWTSDRRSSSPERSMVRHRTERQYEDEYRCIRQP